MKPVYKNLINVLISLAIVIVFAFTVQVSYKESYNEVFAFLAYLVVFIPLIFSTNWKWGIISSVSSIIFLLLFWYFFWFIQDAVNNDFSFENSMGFQTFWFEALKGFVTALIIRILYRLTLFYIKKIYK